jgi:hypothetical protein
MPVFNVRAPDGSLLKINGPEDATDEELIQIAERNYQPKKERTLGGNLKELGKGLIPGGIGLLETAGIGASALLEDDKEKIARKFIKEQAAAGKEYFAPEAGYEESVGRKLGEGLGSTLPFFALGPLKGAGRTAGTGLGVAAGAGEARRAAEEKGATAEERSRATLLGAPTGLFELLAPQIKLFKGLIGNALARGGVEGATEAAQKIAQNLIAKGVYDPKQDVLAGSGEEGAYGAGVGALASLVMDLALGRRGRTTTDTKPSQATPEQTPIDREIPAPEQIAQAPVVPMGGMSADRAAALRAEADAEAAANAPKLALGMNQPFTPVGLPDGSVALTQQDLDDFEREQFEKQYAPQPNLNQAVPAATPPQLGYSPLPGVPKISTSGNVALTPDQELQSQYAPQPVRMTQEVWNTMSPEEQDAFAVKAQLDQQARIDAAQAETAGKRATETGFKGKLSESESEALGLVPKEKKKKAGPAIKATENPENIGVIGTDDNGLPIPGLLSEGAKPFISKDVADYVRKNQPTMKSVQLKDGSYVLSPKTEAEMAREDKTKIHLATAGAKGEPIDASAFIAGRGGLSFDTQPDVYSRDENPKIGNRNLFQKNGVGLDQAGEMLQEAGYFDNLPEGETYTENDVIEAITGKIYRPEDEAFLAEKEIKKREKAEEAVEIKASLDSQIAEDMGYPNTPKGIADSFLERAIDQGIDVESIQEQAAREAQGQPEDFYHDRVSALAREAMNNTSTLYSVNKENKPKKSTTAELKMQKDLEGKSMVQAAQYLVAKAPDAFQKFVAKKVLNTIQEMQARGVDLYFEVQSGNTRNTKLYGAEGLTTHIFGKEGKPLRINLLLNGAPVFENQRGYPSGLSYKTLMHEMLHAATSAKIHYLSDTHPAVKELNDLYKLVAEEYKKQRGKWPEFLYRFSKGLNNSLENPSEMLTWSMTDKDMQQWMSTIKVGDKTVFSKIIDLIRQVLGISKPFETALDRLVRTTDSLLDVDIQVLEDGAIAKGHTFGPSQSKKKMPTQQQTLFSKRAQQLFIEDELTNKLQFGKKAEPTPTGNGQASLDNLAAMGRVVADPDPSYLAKVKESWDNARDNPTATAEAARTSFQRFRDRIETYAFSSDAALNNAIRREVMASSMGQEEKIGLLLNTSLSQTVHSDAVASLFLQKGGISYDNNLHKWVGRDTDDNFVTLSKQLDVIAEKNGLTKPQIELIAHAAFEAKRTQSLIKFNNELAAEIDAIKREATSKRATSPVAASALSEKAQRMKDEFKYIHLDDAQIAAGMGFFKIHPELNEVVKTWNKIRDNAADALVESGLWSKGDAEFLLSNADYVPFYREDQLEQGKGPKEFIRGLKVQAKERKLKGSDKPVNDIFDNQVRWVQYSINRAVRNRSAIALADTAVSVGAAKKVESQKDGANVTRIWRDGKEEFYDMADPMFMEAFNGLEAVVIPSWKWASTLSNILRQSVVMYPLFSVAQVPQDSFAAMFSSGLKPQYALRIPFLAVKEFIQTLRGKSKSHEELKNVGAVGVRDFTSAMVREDAEIFSGLRAPPGFLGKLKYGLNHIAMAADNSVRQAVFEAAEAQGLSKAEAFEKSFEVFNVRRKGSSKTLALASQLIPFFNAYLAAQTVAYKTITGRGTSPQDRTNALQTLAATTASVMTMSLLYSILNGDDEDYLKKPAIQRDRLLMIPGTGGMSIPLRSDFFTMPKIITEHIYLLMTDKGYEDGRKFRESMTNSLVNSLLSPTAVPQAIKPIIEVVINRDFFQGRPLIGTYQKKLETERQFTDSTSELGKFIGSSGLISPIAADHLIRGMFGSVGGLTLYMTSAMLDNNPEAPRPSLSMQDAIATLPGMSGFVAKTYENSLKRDFYALKEEVDKSANTFNDLKKRSPEEIPEFLAKQENMQRLGLQKSVNKVAENLSKIRDNISRITNANMPADEKQKQIQILRKVEEDLLKGVNVKQLREFGMI